MAAGSLSGNADRAVALQGHTHLKENLAMRVLVITMLLARVVLQVQPAAADDTMTAEIETAMQALNDAYTNNDRTTIDSMVTADHIGVTSYGGVQTTAEQFTTLRELKGRYLDYTTIAVTSLGPDSALITYQNSFDGTYAGKPLPARVFVSQIWLKKDGKWLQELYQETPIAAE
jgi:ketosteroid isomerase-like protein